MAAGSFFQYKPYAHAPTPLLQAYSLVPPSPMSDDWGMANGDKASDHGADDAKGSSRSDDAVSSQAAEASAAGPSSRADEPAEGSAAPERAAKRQRKAPIDIDEHIATARQRMKEAQKMVSAAKAQARNEKRRKQRLMKKAATLTSEDLERIAVWKRCGVDPLTGKPSSPSAQEKSHATSSTGSGTLATSPALCPESSPAA